MSIAIIIVANPAERFNFVAPPWVGRGAIAVKIQLSGGYTIKEYIARLLIRGKGIVLVVEEIAPPK